MNYVKRKIIYVKRKKVYVKRNMVYVERKTGYIKRVTYNVLRNFFGNNNFFLGDNQIFFGDRFWKMLFFGDSIFYGDRHGDKIFGDKNRKIWGQWKYPETVCGDTLLSPGQPRGQIFCLRTSGDSSGDRNFVHRWNKQNVDVFDVLNHIDNLYGIAE